MKVIMQYSVLAGNSQDNEDKVCTSHKCVENKAKEVQHNMLSMFDMARSAGN